MRAVVRELQTGGADGPHRRLEARAVPVLAVGDHDRRPQLREIGGQGLVREQRVDGEQAVVAGQESDDRRRVLARISDGAADRLAGGNADILQRLVDSLGDVGEVAPAEPRAAEFDRRRLRIDGEHALEAVLQRDHRDPDPGTVTRS